MVRRSYLALESDAFSDLDAEALILHLGRLQMRPQPFLCPLVVVLLLPMPGALVPHGSDAFLHRAQNIICLSRFAALKFP